jgi:signal transduction histidine kinase
VVDNAVRFTPRGEVRVTAAPEGPGAVRVVVEDSGQGLPAAAREELFALFNQADNSFTRAHEGLGLGLTLARRTVEHLGGALGMEPGPGGGTRVWMRLPMPSIETPTSAHSEGAPWRLGAQSAT